MTTDKTVTYGDIGWAVNHMRHGHRVARKGWSGRGMWLRLDSTPDVTDRVPEDLGLGVMPYVLMKTADNWLVPWLCSQTDLLAADWELVGS